MKKKCIFFTEQKKKKLKGFGHIGPNEKKRKGKEHIHAGRSFGE